MLRHGLKIGNRIKVLTGVYSGGTGRVQALSENVAKCIGCRVTMTDSDGKKTTQSVLVWFDPDKNEIEKVEG